MTDVAVYCRYSTMLQREASIEDQRRRCAKACAAKGWRIVYEESDQAVSGTRHSRPGLDALLAKLSSKAKPFDVLVVDDLSRLSRDIGHAIPLVFDRLAGAGVAVFDASTGAESTAKEARMAMMLAMMFADQQLQTLRHQTSRCLEGRILRGGSAGGRHYGYRSESDPACPGGRRLVVHQHERAVVERVFLAFGDGLSLRAVARMLTAEGTPGPRETAGARPGWSGSAVRSLLLNPLYTGEVVWGRTRRARVAGADAWRRERQAPDHVTRFQVPELAIIDKDLWERAQARFAEGYARRGRPQGTGSKGSALLGVLRCGLCSGPMTTIGRKQASARFGCSERARKGPDVCEGVRSLHEGRVLPVLARAIQVALEDHDVAGLVAAEISARRRVASASRDGDAARLRKLESDERRTLDAIAACGDEHAAARPSLLAYLDKLSTMRAELARALASSTPATPPLPLPTVLDLEPALSCDPARGREVLRAAFGSLVVDRDPHGVRVRSRGPVVVDLAIPMRPTTSARPAAAKS